VLKCLDLGNTLWNPLRTAIPDSLISFPTSRYHFCRNIGSLKETASNITRRHGMSL